MELDFAIDPNDQESIEELIMSGAIPPADEDTTALHHRFWDEDPARPAHKARRQHHFRQCKERYRDERGYLSDL